jgi:hypothetical protein
VTLRAGLRHAVLDDDDAPRHHIIIICVAACALVGAALLARTGRSAEPAVPLLSSPPAFELQGIDPAAG